MFSTTKLPCWVKIIAYLCKWNHFRFLMVNLPVFLDAWLFLSLYQGIHLKHVYMLRMYPRDFCQLLGCCITTTLLPCHPLVSFWKADISGPYVRYLSRLWPTFFRMCLKSFLDFCSQGWKWSRQGRCCECLLWSHDCQACSVGSGSVSSTDQTSWLFDQVSGLCVIYPLSKKFQYRDIYRWLGASFSAQICSCHVS